MREKRSDLPNFRDHGKMVDRPLLRLVRNLQKMQGGYALVSDRSLRAMIHEDTGHLPGVDTLRKAMQRLEPLGYIERRQVRRGCTRPDGQLAEVGSMCLRVPLNAGQKRAIASAASKVDHRKGVGERVTRVPFDPAVVARALSSARSLEAPRAAADPEAQRELARRMREFEATLTPEERYGPGGKRDS